jgi:plastocyanin
MVVSIRKVSAGIETVLWTKSIAGGDTEKYVSQAEGVSVQPGDRIYFVVNKGVDTSSDTVVWDQRVFYTDGTSGM